MTPARWMSKLLQDKTLTGTGTGWTPYYGFLPADPDKAVVIYDVGTMREGRYMENGLSVMSSVIQVRVRSVDYTEGWKHAENIFRTLEQIKPSDRIVIALLPDPGPVTQTWSIPFVSYSHRNGPISIGREEKGNRELFTINGVVKLGEATALPV